MNVSSDIAVERVGDFLPREGLGDKPCQRKWFKKGEISVNGDVATEETLLHPGDTLTIREADYQVSESREPGRLTMKRSEFVIPERLPGKIRVQCGYHKCLTMYFRRLYKKTAHWDNPITGRYRHFFHRADEFYRDCVHYNISSVSGHCLDLDRFDDIRVVHIIRDPRDMIVSGYYYHKRAGEPWCDYLNPTDDDWSIVNAPVPDVLPPETSFAGYLNAVSLEQGLKAEFDFRRNHFASMLSWPTDDPRVLTVKYEDIVGDEANTLSRIYEHYGAAFYTRIAARMYADRYSLKSERRLSSHIRNPKKGQWRDLFTPELKNRFNQQYGDLLEKFGYPPG